MSTETAIYQRRVKLYEEQARIALINIRRKAKSGEHSLRLMWLDNYCFAVKWRKFYKKQLKESVVHSLFN